MTPNHHIDFILFETSGSYMAIKKNENSWLVDIYPNGRSGKRIRKKFDTRLEAQRFEKYVLNKSFDDKEWNPTKEDNRTLRELIDFWYDSHGKFLKGALPRRRTLLNVDQRLGHPIARKIDPSHYLAERASRIKNGVTPKTCNNELGYLNAIFNELERTKIIAYPNPLKSIGHGRNIGRPMPPAQIRTCATNAYGSYFEYLAQKRISG